MNVGIIIQARMLSTRLPGKVLKKLCGKTILQRTIQAAQRANIGRTMVVTGDAPENMAIEQHCSDLGVNCHRGSEHDVLQRYARAVERTDFDIICRLTSDCPLVDRRMIRTLVDDFQETPGHTYLGCANSPDGNDVEVFTRGALLSADRLCTEPRDREHVCLYMRRMPGRMPYPEPAHSIKYSVDTQEDFDLCAKLLDECGEDAPWQAYVAAAHAH